MQVDHVFISSAAQPTVGIGDLGGQLHSSFYGGFAILGGNIVSDLQFFRKGKTTDAEDTY